MGIDVPQSKPVVRTTSYGYRFGALFAFVASIHNCITYEYETKIDIQTKTTKFLDEIEKTDTSEKGALGFFKVSVNSQR